MYDLRFSTSGSIYLGLFVYIYIYVYTLPLHNKAIGQFKPALYCVVRLFAFSVKQEFLPQKGSRLEVVQHGAVFADM
jgi:hypothetical protein